MRPESIVPSPELILLSSLLILLTCAAILFYLQQLKRGNITLPWAGESAPTLHLPWPLFVACIVLLVINYFFAPLFLPVAAVFVAGLAAIANGQNPAAFWNLRWRKIPDYLKTALLILPIILLPLYAIALIYDLLLVQLGLPLTSQPAVEKFLQLKNGRELLLFTTNAFLIAPIWEEIAFRGFLYPVLKRKLGRWHAMNATAILFGAMHAHLPTFLPLALLGAVLTLLYEKKASLGYPIALHAIFNACSMLVILTIKST